MERRKAIIQVFLRSRLISEVEGEGISVVADGVTLKAISLSFVCDPELVLVLSVKSYRFLITRSITGKQPSIPPYDLEMTEVLINLEIRMGFPRRDRELRVLKTEAAFPLAVPKRCIGSKSSSEEWVRLNRIRLLRLQLVFDSGRRIESIEKRKVHVLLKLSC